MTTLRHLFRRTRHALARAVVLALVLPLALSSSLPALARSLGGPVVHVCRCEVKGGHSTCACPICHPDREDLKLCVESIRGQCGDEDPVFGGTLALALAGAATVTVVKAPVSTPLPTLPSSISPDSVRAPPTPPPRSNLV